jgi:hypothetical protein
MTIRTVRRRLKPHALSVSVLILLLLGSRAFAASVTRLPYVQNVGTTQVTLMWRSDTTAAQTVEYGIDQDFAQSKASVDSTHHEVTLTNLQPGQTYSYRIVENGNVLVSGSQCHFKTDAGRDDGQFSFFVTGDVGEDDPTQAMQHFTQAAIRNVAPRAEFGLICGDVVYPDGLSSDYDAYLMTPWKDLLANTAVWPALGNHDWHASPDENFTREWALPGNEHYYSFDYGNAHFIALDTADNYIYDQANQVAWLQADLQAHSDAEWTFAYFHHPMFTCTYKGDSRDIGDQFMPLFEAYGVDIVFTGHAHTYERLYPVRNYTPLHQNQEPHYKDPGAPIYVVTGCGGKVKVGEPTTFCGPTAAFQDETVSFTQVFLQGNLLALLQIDSRTGRVMDVMTLTKTLTTSSVATLPAPRRLGQNTPNPFNPTTTIPFELARDAMVSLDVYRPDGRWITNLARRVFSAGQHRVVWNGLDHGGRALSSGIYFLNLQSEGESETIKMMLVR